MTEELEKVCLTTGIKQNYAYYRKRKCNCDTTISYQLLKRT
jgi:hypothetical protein